MTVSRCLTSRVSLLSAFKSKLPPSPVSPWSQRWVAFHCTLFHSGCILSYCGIVVFIVTWRSLMRISARWRRSRISPDLGKSPLVRCTQQQGTESSFTKLSNTKSDAHNDCKAHGPAESKDNFFLNVFYQLWLEMIPLSTILKGSCVIFNWML